MKQKDRLSLEKELEFISPEKEAHNMYQFARMMYEWGLGVKDTEIILNNIIKKNRKGDIGFLDRFFNLNEQGRAWFKVLIRKDNDTGYSEYKNTLRNKVSNEKDPEIKDKVLSLIYNHNILSYKVYKENKVEVNNNIFKLFSMLKKYQIFDGKDIDKLNTYKTRGDLYLCISRNPIDMLFASTNQSFSSCENLYGRDRTPQSTPLGSTILDPNRVIVFVSNGNLKKFPVLSDIEMYHFRYICRSWGLLSQEDELVLIRHYPNNVISMAEYLNKFGIKSYDTFNGRFIPNFKSKLSFKKPNPPNRPHKFVYVDYIKHQSTGYYEANKHSTRGCDHCETGLNISDMKIVNRNNDVLIVCGSCAKRFYILCPICGEQTDDRSVRKSPDGEKICRFCYNREYGKCSKCNNDFHLEDLIYSGDSNAAFCDKCATEENNMCPICNKSIERGIQVKARTFRIEFEKLKTKYRMNRKELLDNGEVCEDCYHKYYFKCDACQTIKERSLGYPRIASGQELCSNCSNKVMGNSK